ncbi:MAG: nickel pincer cofactor biosynthesis protein LarB [Actinobacteria bacterium]|nr:MAG: nickel pincer cofactor biosynthesis protein LarB [Actinomycetota bacterium]
MNAAHHPPPDPDPDWATLDYDRADRTGHPEVVFGEGKTPPQLVGVLRLLGQAHSDRAVLATRVSAAGRAAVRADLPAAEVDEVGRTVVLGPFPPPTGLVAVVSAGTADAPVCAEVATTLRAFGAGVDLVRDVGVAGIHRVLAARDRLTAPDAVVVVAGMDGALPSVVGGLTSAPVVAVPTSVGYGASFGGVAALLTMLNSCAPGVAVVNIDNGFGAAVHAARIALRNHL